MKEPVEAEVAQALVASLSHHFHWPWHIERDWGYEVIDAKGNRVALCIERKMAKKIVSLGEAHQKNMEQLDDTLLLIGVVDGH